MNNVTMIGRLASDPEARTTQSGVMQVSFRIAVQRRFKGANGERQTDFFPCVAWRQTAEFISRFASKGDLMSVRGELQTHSYDAQDGTKRYVTEIIVDEAQKYGGSQSRTEETERPNIAQTAAQIDAKTAAAAFGFTVVEDMDDLPF